MERLEKILKRRLNGERISVAEGLDLWQNAPLALLGKYAVMAKKAVSGDMVYYNRNVHLEPTNVCRFKCKFCSYRRERGAEGAWELTMEEIFHRAERYAKGDITEVHIVGGVHPDHGFDYYLTMIRGVKERMPNVAIKAFTAVELASMIKGAGLSFEQGLRELHAAGMESIPGGGAEIFDEGVRATIAPDKGTSEEWLALHKAAHKEGIPTNATILYGHIEEVEHRIDHLDRLRKLQDETGGFNAFVPLKYRVAGNELGVDSECSTVDDMRMVALSRLMLDNIPHIKSYWVMYGKEMAEMALSFGADDIDGTIDDTTAIFSMAGAEQKPSFGVEQMRKMVDRAGFKAVERDTHYNEII